MGCYGEHGTRCTLYDKTMVKNYTDQQLLDKVKSLPTFKQIPSHEWLLGVRSNEDNPDQFDDKIYMFRGEQFITVTSATTNPGVSILKGGFKSYNNVGAAMLVADQWYYNIWIKGKHRGKATGLLQRGAKVKVHRDGDMDNKSEATSIIQEGMFGINFHPNTHDFNAMITKKTIGAWSAGCQVVNDMVKYRQIMNAMPERVLISYCLLNEF